MWWWWTPNSWKWKENPSKLYRTLTKLFQTLPQNTPFSSVSQLQLTSNKWIFYIPRSYLLLFHSEPLNWSAIPHNFIFHKSKTNVKRYFHIGFIGCQVDIESCLGFNRIRFGNISIEDSSPAVPSSRSRCLSRYYENLTEICRNCESSRKCRRHWIKGNTEMKLKIYLELH